MVFTTYLSSKLSRVIIKGVFSYVPDYDNNTVTVEGSREP